MLESSNTKSRVGNGQLSVGARIRLATKYLLAITNTTWERRKAAGADSSDLRPIWLPTVDNLRNFLLGPTTEMLSVFNAVAQHFVTSDNSRRFDLA